MVYKTNALCFCPDCFSFSATGDATFLDGLYLQDEADSVMGLIERGLERITREMGAVVTAGAVETGFRRGSCDCCGRDTSAEWHVVETITGALGRKMGDEVNPSNSHYVDPRFILSASVQPMEHHKRGLSYTASGYGSKIPTEYAVHCADSRTRRVYAAVFGNSGSLWINHKGERLWLDADAETKLEEARL